MSDDIMKAVADGLEKTKAELKADLDAAIEKHTGQVQENGKAHAELTEEIKKIHARLMEVEQKGADKLEGKDKKLGSWGEQFTKSDEFKAVAEGRRERVRLEVKNTVDSDSTTVFPFQKPGVIPGSFVPLTVRAVLRSIPVSSNAVNSLREETWTNSAAEVSHGALKPESDITFENYDVPIRTVAHFIKVTNQLLADAPAIAAYIDNRARDGLAQRIENQLLNGNGTSPNLSGLTDSGNFTAYTPTSGDLLVDAINRIKYTAWAAGNPMDTVIVNPADWGAMERTREGAGSGMYLYGVPGMDAGMNPFGLRVVLSPYLQTGKVLVMQTASAAVVYDRQAATVELGYVEDDFTRNLVTIRVEERLGLGVERPAAVYYGDYTA